MEFSPVAGGLPGVTVQSPGELTFSQATLGGLPSCQTLTVDVNTGALNLSNTTVPEIIEKTINIRVKTGSKNPTNLNVGLGSTPDNVKISVTVLPG